MQSPLIERTLALRAEVEKLSFPPSLFVYDPLLYAWEPHRMYLERALHPVPLFLLGMNPGPFGMAQTGVPFGEIAAVRDFLGIEAPVGKPRREHPSRPVLGFSCPRSEVSGRRLWGFLRSHFKSADACFSHLVVMNYCPLVFMDAGKTGRNVPPDTLGKSLRTSLEDACDRYLSFAIDFFKPGLLVGIGRYAKAKLEKASPSIPVDYLIHPSPGNPQANRGWAEKAEEKFREWGFPPCP